MFAQFNAFPVTICVPGDVQRASTRPANSLRVGWFDLSDQAAVELRAGISVCRYVTMTSRVMQSYCHFCLKELLFTISTHNPQTHCNVGNLF